MDRDSLIAGILHDTVEDNPDSITFEEIGVSRHLSQIDQNKCCQGELGRAIIFLLSICNFLIHGNPQRMLKLSNDSLRHVESSFTMDKLQIRTIL